ncbi:hypothetical protein T4D_3343 [Trichinella pseudospiralis]|uniref:Uncharacterized protein n=1 Tax=Trichinella pseudospiralis TaxID=6337 RepID=A0A0V1FS46_TRIPS|nr:hypothetical protein T4D_3343 [Trichinella pseudospiralis]
MCIKKKKVVKKSRHIRYMKKRCAEKSSSWLTCISVWELRELQLEQPQLEPPPPAPDRSSSRMSDM